MEEYKLGPNGGMLYCADFLLANMQWLTDEIEKKLLQDRCRYFIFDLPGQTELYTNHNALKEIICKLEKEHNFKMVAVNMIDASYLYDRYKFLSAMTLSLTSLIGIEIPFINLVTKMDLLAQMGRPDMNLMFYQGTTHGLKYLFFPEFDMVEHHDGAEAQKASRFTRQFSLLTKNLCELIEQYSQVSLNLVDIRDQMSMSHAIMKIDKANHFFNQEARLQNAQETQLDYEAIEQYYLSSEAVMDLEEKYFNQNSDDNDEGDEDDEQRDD